MTGTPPGHALRELDRALSGAAISIVGLLGVIVLPWLTLDRLASHAHPWGLVDALAVGVYLLAVANVVLVPTAVLSVVILLIGLVTRAEQPRSARPAARTAAAVALVPLLLCLGLILFVLLVSAAHRVGV